MEPKLLDIPPEQYHADDVGLGQPTLSSSIATTLLTRSPLHAWAEHPRLGAIPRKPTDEMEQGTLIHAMLLGKGAELDVLKHDNYRTKDAQTARDEAREAGRVPVLEREYDELTEIVGHLHARLSDAGVILRGTPEATIVWGEKTARHPEPVPCRRMIDMLDLDNGVVLELKTISSADERTCNRTAVALGYDISMAATLSAVGQLEPGLAGRLVYKHVFIEKAPSNEKPRFKPPYPVVVRDFDGAFEELGMRRWERAVALWEDCLTKDDWPCYPATPLTAPVWALQEFEESL